jgi:hypothetical protein
MKELSHVDDVYSILGDLTGGFTANFALTNLFQQLFLMQL